MVRSSQVGYEAAEDRFTWEGIMQLRGVRVVVELGDAQDAATRAETRRWVLSGVRFRIGG
jgi:hypothetical protein